MFSPLIKGGVWCSDRLFPGLGELTFGSWILFRVQICSRVLKILPWELGLGTMRLPGASIQLCTQAFSCGFRVAIACFLRTVMSISLGHLCQH